MTKKLASNIEFERIYEYSFVNCDDGVTHQTIVFTYLDASHLQIKYELRDTWDHTIYIGQSPYYFSGLFLVIDDVKLIEDNGNDYKYASQCMKGCRRPIQYFDH